MGLQVLLSAMHLDDESYIDSLNITSDCVVINQCDREKDQNIVRKNLLGNEQKVKYIETKDRGLSRSRNMAIYNASEDICIFCDNDVEYVDNYQEIILNAFDTHKDADLIVFYIKRKEKLQPNFADERRMGYLSVLKIFSPEIAFRREAVSDIKFDEKFGAGSNKYIMGEENIFLYDCLKAHKKIYYVPTKIAELREVESTWFSGYDERFFISRGANYAAMTRLFSLLLILQFAVRKTKEYKDEMSIFGALKYMLKGRREYLKG